MTSRKRKPHRKLPPAAEGRSSSAPANALQNEALATAGSQALSPSPLWLVLSAALALLALLWAYWPTLATTWHNWETQPDYSHGYLVVPIALFFLWSRRGSMPRSRIQPNLIWGLVLLLLVTTVRVLAGAYYLLPLDGWTLPLAVAGIVCLLYGLPVLWWSLPSIVFLWFMMPMPYSAERWLSVPLQAMAAKFSTAVLVFLGQPAIAEGNVLLLGDHTLFVEEACSGMRIFIGIFALAFAFVLFSRWSWWQKGLVLLAALPVAIVANVTRIVVTGLLYQWVSSEAGHKFSHDVAGFVMIPFAALLLWLLLIYLDRLFPLVEEIRQPQFLRSGATENS